MRDLYATDVSMGLWWVLCWWSRKLCVGVSLGFMLSFIWDECK